jgi:hypothetical protein
MNKLLGSFYCKCPWCDKSLSIFGRKRECSFCGEPIKIIIEWWPFLIWEFFSSIILWIMSLSNSFIAGMIFAFFGIIFIFFMDGIYLERR